MKRNNFFITPILFLMILILASCDSSGIKSLEVYYNKPGISTPYAQFCSDNLFINQNDIRYKKIDDDDFLSEFETQINTLESSDENSVDSRVYILINYHDAHIDTLCVGETWGICLNNNIMKHNQKFHELIMNEIDFYDKEKYHKK